MLGVEMNEINCVELRTFERITSVFRSQFAGVILSFTFLHFRASEMTAAKSTINSICWSKSEVLFENEWLVFDDAFEYLQ